ncbi:leucine--tRNA ligase, mitochondrial [Leguminivora glycinivorella]|uniref:leucine--tRNA ligase, mitochondrial n=1 Tax=Leguminivora glycinivorella TaxID=1035111 RepID=UPI00200D67B2|nr:leucine--tRNA ligase, mitochondrial [Leguminivora glycinivorella]
MFLNTLKYKPLYVLRKHQVYFVLRSLHGSLGLWPQDLNSEIKLKIEKHWSEEVQKEQSVSSGKLHYVLAQFPYPSGNLHMGHVRVYSISDTIARYHKLNGDKVIHPIGWDAFGLPAENAAIERNVQPQHWTATNIESMKKQLLDLGFNFDWNRELSTCDPEYYRWTQHIFLKLFENGLAYQSKASVNWDPVDQTVLADEQVDEQGCSWRSGAKVEKKILTQWFIKTTKFAQKLYDGLSSEQLENWKDIINLQKHWIGECNGTVVTFNMLVNDELKTLDVWTSDPYKLIHGEFLLISRDNLIAQELNNQDGKLLKAINPITEAEIPVYISEDANYAEGRDVYLACPSVDETDKVLAHKIKFCVKPTCSTINIARENKRAIDLAKSKDVGGHLVSSKLKDWLISRQRYWGTPIPIIHCPDCGPVPVPYDQLPLKLPKLDYAETNSKSLADLHDWVNCKCPQCNASSKRETDTMDTFVDSSWYYYRFLDPKNNIAPFNKENLQGCSPVQIYIGGKEHAVLHLYYARFMSYFLHSLGWTVYEEPFKKLLVQGMVMGQSYKLKSSGKYIPAENVEKIEKKYVEKLTQQPVAVQWEKMSKSKYNGENPERLLTTYGCDTTRLLILADVPPATSRHWSEATFPGVLNWQHRLWITVRDFIKHRNDVTLYQQNNITSEEFENIDFKLWDSRNYFTANTSYHFKYTHMLSVGISRLQALTNALRNKVPAEVIAKSKEYELALAALIIMLSPVAPHFCSELWAGFLSAPNRIALSSPLINWQENVLGQRWPKVDDHYKLSLLCKIDGVDRCELKIAAPVLDRLGEEEAMQMMLDQADVAFRISRGIIKTKYELFPGSRAILNLFTNRSTNKKKETDTENKIATG